MAIKLVAMDLDDTLLNLKTHEISPANLAAVRRAQEAGFYVTLATGRHFSGAKRFIGQFCRADVPVIVFGGAAVCLPGGAQLRRVALAQPLVARLAVFARARGLYMQCYHGEDFYYGTYDARTKAYEMHTGKAGKQADLANYPFEYSYKCLFIMDEGAVPAVWRALEAEFPGEVYLSQSHANYIEVNAPGADKGSALRFVAEHLGVAPEEVLAMGDNSIDLAMLSFAGVGVAMGNASAALKAAADIVAPSCEEDGVAAILTRLVEGTL